MARPKKEIDENRQVVMSYRDYMVLVNFVAHAMHTNQQMAARQMAGASSLMSLCNQSLVQVQSLTKSMLAKNSIDEASVSADSYPAIQKLLSTDKATIGEAMGSDLMGDLPLQITLPEIKVQKKRKPRKPKDPNAPKRPVTAFFLFLAENKEHVKNEMPPDSRPGEIQKQATVYWNELPPDKQERYKAKYRANFERYRKQLEEYKAQGGQVDEGELKPDDENATHLAGNGDDVASSDDGSSDSESDGGNGAGNFQLPLVNKAGKGAPNRAKKRGADDNAEFPGLPSTGMPSSGMPSTGMASAGMPGSGLQHGGGMSAGLPPSANMFDEANYLSGKPGEPERKKKKKHKTQQQHPGAAPSPYLNSAL